MSSKLSYFISVVCLVGWAAGVALGDSPYDRAAYWDASYGSAWAGDGGPVRDALEAAGYTILDADELKTWMDGHIADKRLSVVVFCKDAAPDTVAEEMTPNCTLRKYLDAGGKVVWYSDIPFYYMTTAGGARTTWADAGSTNVLGFGGSTAPRDSYDEVTITEAGIEWGLTTTWQSRRPTLPDAWDNLTILAVDNAGNAAGWVAHYVPGDTFRGFVRIEDFGSGDGTFDVDNIIAVAEYGQLPTTAISPSPPDGAIDIPRDTGLTWEAAETAAQHNVYFGTVVEDVNAGTGDVTVSMGQTDTSFDPGRLEFGQTYFWRVDEVNGAPDNTVFKGGIWSFEVEPVAYPIANITATASSQQSPEMSPQKTIDGSGLNELDQHGTTATDMWLHAVGDANPSIQYEFDMAYKLHQLIVWNSNQMIESFLGLGAKDVVIETSLDGAEWVVLEGATQLNQAPGAADYAANTTIDFGGAMAQFVRITVNASWGTVMPNAGISEVRFSFIPALAREPQPLEGATMDSVGVVLGWRAGREAAAHEVYVGTDSADLPLVGTVADNSLDLSDQGLAYATTYFWKVKEVNEAETPAAHDGPVWSFITPDFGTVDDFDQYDDDCKRIFFAWEDGIGHNGGEEVDDCDEPASNGNGGGSIVGNDQAPFAEKAIATAGSKQSLPFSYDNSFGDSFATLALDGQDWSASGIQTLSLAFRGETGNTGTVYVKINNTKITYDGPAINIGRSAWQVWNIVLADTGASLSNVTSLAIGVDGASAAGTLYIDDIRLYPVIFEAGTVDITTPGDTLQGVPNDADWPAAEAPEFVIDDDSGTKYLHFKGISEPTGFHVTPSVGATIVTGLTFTTANDAAERDPVAYELSGSNAGIGGPFTVIAAGDIVDFSQATAWPRLTANETQISFDNSVAYAHYQLIITAIRDAGSANSMQVAEVELLGEL